FRLWETRAALPPDRWRPKPPVSPPGGIQRAAHLEIPRTQLTAKLPAWRALEDRQRAMRDRHLRTLFADDPARSERMTVEAAGVFLDYSKNRIDDEALRLLIELAERSQLRARITALFPGRQFNYT